MPTRKRTKERKSKTSKRKTKARKKSICLFPGTTSRLEQAEERIYKRKFTKNKAKKVSGTRIQAFIQIAFTDAY